MRRLYATRVSIDLVWPNLTKLGFAHTRVFGPETSSDIADSNSDFHVIFLATATATRYALFESMIKNAPFFDPDLIEFDYFNLNKIEE